MSREQYTQFIRDYRTMRNTRVFDPNRSPIAKHLTRMQDLERTYNGKYLNWGTVTSYSYVRKLMNNYETRLKAGNRRNAGAALEMGSGIGTGGGLRGGSCHQLPPCDSDECWDEACE